MKGLSKNWIGVYKSAQNILVNFFHVGEKDLNFRFYWFVLSKTQIASTKTFWQEFHFITMKHHKKFGQKLNRGFQISQKNWWISLQQAKRVEVSNFIGLFCLRGKLPEPKVLTGARFCHTEWSWKVWANTELWLPK